MIEVQGLNKTYGQKQVLTNVSFRAENGLVTGFVGPNGAGKSTTMRMIAALEEPDSGTTLVDGQPFSKAAMPAQLLGVYLGSDYLPIHLTAAEYLAYVCTTNGLDKASIPSLLQMVELAHVADKPISSFSLGMRQRAGLAAAMAGNPANLMLDEPVNGLDPMGVQWLRGVIREQARQGRAVLLSSHLLSEHFKLSNKPPVRRFGHTERHPRHMALFWRQMVNRLYSQLRHLTVHRPHRQRNRLGRARHDFIGLLIGIFARLLQESRADHEIQRMPDVGRTYGRIALA